MAWTWQRLSKFVPTFIAYKAANFIIWGKGSIKQRKYRISILYFKMAVIPLVPETKMADVGKLISLGNLLVRKVMWFMLTTMSATLILSCAFGADRTTRIVYIYSHLLRTHSLHFVFQRLHTHTHTHTLSLSLSLSLSHTHFNFQRQHTLSLSSFWLPETAWPCQLVSSQFNTLNMGAYKFCNLFLSCSTFSVRLVPASNTASEILSNPERDKQPTWEKTRFS